jgi:glycosyltransferase involved in cell wall biosynthesis
MQAGCSRNLGGSLPGNKRGKPAAQRAIRRAVEHPAQLALRLHRSLPEPVRARIRAAAVWADQRRPAAPIEDWSGPLIEKRLDAPGARPEPGLVRAMATPGGLAVVGPASPPQPADGLRCLVVTGLLDVGGMDEVVAFLARRLPASGIQTAVLHATSSPSPTGEPGGRLGRMLRSAGIEVVEADAKRAATWMERWRPEVITAHGAPDWVLDIAQRLGIPYVDNLHGMHTHFWADWGAEARRSARLSAMVSVSGLVRDQYLAGNPGFPPSRITVIPNGVDEQRRVTGDRAAVRSRLGLTTEYVFVSLARYCLQKNTYGLLAAFGEAARYHGDAHLVVAGRPDDIRYYRRVLRLRESLPCRDRVHLRDHATAPAELLAAADGFVLDSFFEGWSLASMEALFAGLPVVLSEVGGAREQVGDGGERGHVVANPLGDPLSVDWAAAGAARYQPQVNSGELAAAMRDLIVRREDYLGNREHLAAQAAARFSADTCLARHAEVLSAVAAGAELPVSA